MCCTTSRNTASTKGRAFHFPVTACQTFGFHNVDACPFVPSFFVAVNVPFVWVVLPIAALWCRRNPAVGLTGAGLLLTNAMSHILGALTPLGYSPGTGTAALIFIPLSVWVFVTCFGPANFWPGRSSRSSCWPASWLKWFYSRCC